MPATSHDTNNRRSAGFTLVEVLVIAPLVLLLVGVLVGAIVVLTGDTLRSQGQASMTHELQNALNYIERDIRQSETFMSASGALPSPQGSNNGTAQFTTGNALLILQTRVTTNPFADNRELVVYADQPNACSSPDAIQNTPLTMTVVYFLRDNSLWRRTILPANTATGAGVCQQPGEVNSCTPTVSHSRCTQSDMRLVRNADTSTIEYFSSPAGTTPIAATAAASARSVNVNLNTTRTIAGRELSRAQQLRTSLALNLQY